jgi:excisionase family DNA binding protein
MLIKTDKETKMETTKLLNLKEVSRILNLNTEVLRRWLRNKKLPGIKVGSDWRVNEKDLEPFLNPDGTNTQTAEKQQPKMCFRFPKWLEFSGLPAQLNRKFGPEAWPVFKKIIELDFELGKPENREVTVACSELAERVGYTEKIIMQVLKDLEGFELIKFKTGKNDSLILTVVTPLKTPKLVLDISFAKGGVKDAPSQALKNTCLRRYLEVDEF